VKRKLKRVKEYYNPKKKLTVAEREQKQFFLSEIEDLNSFVESKGYEMIILNQTGPLHMQVKLLEALKLKGYKTMDLGNPNKYPEFYDPENMFDISHLTRKGAMAFTEELIKEYQALAL